MGRREQSDEVLRIAVGSNSASERVPRETSATHLNMTDVMPLYRSDEPCIKCGCLGPALYWEHTADGVEYLLCACWKCHFTWCRRPLDWVEPSEEVQKDKE